MRAAGPEAGSQRAGTRIAVTRAVASMTLKRPKTSAKRPDMMRPKMLCDGRVSAIAGGNSSDALGQGCRDGGRAFLAALRMGRRYGDSVLETPLAPALGE